MGYADFGYEAGQKYNQWARFLMMYQANSA